MSTTEQSIETLNPDIQVLTAKQLKERIVAEERYEHEIDMKTENILDRFGRYMLNDEERFYVYLVNLDKEHCEIDQSIRTKLISHEAYEGNPSGDYTQEPELVFSDEDYDVKLYRWSNFVQYADYQEPEAFDVCYEACRGDQLPIMWQLKERG